MYNKSHTEKTKRKISKNHADVSGNNNPNYRGGISNTRDYNYCKNNRCVDCGRLVTNNSKRCFICEGRIRKETFHHSIKTKNRISKKLIGRKISEETKRKRRQSVAKHHIYLKENSDEVLELTHSRHHQLHIRAYHYIYDRYGKKGIDNYIKWFFKKYGVKK